MKIKHQISFNNIPKLENELSKLGITFKLIEGIIGRLVIFTIPEKDVKWPLVSTLIAEYNLKTTPFTEFDKVEYKNAEWFLMKVRESGYPEPQMDFGYLQATFDLSDYCDTCSIGKKQTNPFYVKAAPKLKLDLFCLNWVFDEHFVTLETKKSIENYGIKGVIFREVLHNGTKKPLEGIYQLTTDYTLNGGLDPFNLGFEECQDHKSSIDRRKFNYPAIGGITIDKSYLPKEKDIVKSHEWFGSGKEAHRLTICSRRFYDHALKERWRGISFSPIFHEKHKI